MNDRISVDTAARMIGLSRRTIYSMLRTGELPGARLRGRWVISRAAVNRRLRELGLEVTP